jgi:hypothetical protein
MDSGSEKEWEVPVMECQIPAQCLQKTQAQGRGARSEVSFNYRHLHPGLK